MTVTVPALRLANVSKSYPGFQLRHINLELPAGYILGFIGPNGSGKSTTLRIAANLGHPDSGHVEFFGKRWDEDEVGIKSRIGYVPEHDHLYELATGNWLGDFLRRYYATWDDRYFHNLLEKFKVPGDKPVGNLSKGGRLKLAVVLALAHRPQLLIMDEPTSGMDPVVRHTLLQELLEVVQDENRSVLFSSHIVSDIEKVADLVSYIVDGQILYSGAKDVLLERWKQISLHVENPNRVEQISRLLTFVRSKGREITGYTDSFSPELQRQLEEIAGREIRLLPLDLEEIMVLLVNKEEGKNL